MANKRDVAVYLAAKNNMSILNAKLMIDDVLDSIWDVLVESQTLTLTKWGRFDMYARDSRMARNPHSGEHVQIPEKLAIRFELSRKLKDVLYDLEKEELTPKGKAIMTELKERGAATLAAKDAAKLVKDSSEVDIVSEAETSNVVQLTDAKVKSKSKAKKARKAKQKAK